MDKNLIRFMLVAMGIVLCKTVSAQSWLVKNFEVDAIELKAGQGLIENQVWRDGLFGASALSHLDVSRDNAGLKNQSITTVRPYDVKFQYDDLSGYCCGNTDNNNYFSAQLGVKAQSKKSSRLRLGAGINIVNRAFGRHDSYHLDDKPYGDETLYFVEEGKFDAVSVSKGFGQNQFDTLFTVQRAKMVYVETPGDFIGFNINGQFVLHESRTSRNHLSVTFGGGLMTAKSKRTKIYFRYYDYSRISSGEYGSGSINGYYLSSYDDYSVNVAGRTSNKPVVFSFKTPAVHSASFSYGMEFSRKLFKKAPLTITLGFGARYNTYWRNWETIATSKSVFYQVGFGWLLQKKAPID
jgi:hypothetical protein